MCSRLRVAASTDPFRYYWVQINALYMGYLYARRSGARAVFQAILDHTWADVCASYFAPAQVGALSRYSRPPHPFNHVVCGSFETGRYYVDVLAHTVGQR
jgi:hypothetical protein